MRASSNSARSATWTEAESAHPIPASRRDVWRVVLLCLLLSLISLLYCWRQGWLLLYGDAVAHLHIARRILDSRTP